MKTNRLFIVIVFFSLFACGKSEKDTAGDQAEITFSKNTKTLEKVLEIGGIDAPPEASFHQLSDIAVDNNGNIYVADRGNRRIQKFSANGEFITSIGRAGQGPGEFGLALSIEIDENNYLFVADLQYIRVHVFSPEGEFVKIIKLPNANYGKFKILENRIICTPFRLAGRILIQIDTNTGETIEIKPKELSILNKFNSEGKNIQSFAIIPRKNFLLFNKADRQFYLFDSDGVLLRSFPIDHKNLNKLIALKEKISKQAEQPSGSSAHGVVGVSIEQALPVIGNMRYVNGFIYALFYIMVGSGEEAREESILYQIDPEGHFVNEFVGFSKTFYDFTMDKNNFIYALDRDEEKVIKYRMPDAME